MRNSRLIIHLAKSRLVRTLGVITVLFLIMEPISSAMNQVISKFPTGYTIAVSAMGNGMSHDDGSVFGFNSAKSAADTDAFATIQEGGCFAPNTSFDFSAGRSGWTTVAGTGLTYGYSGVEGKIGPGALQSRLNNQNATRPFSWSKTFLWDCGIPSGAVPVSIWYRRGAIWTAPGTLSNLRVELVKPDASVVTLIAATTIDGAANSAWLQLSAADVSSNFNQMGVYTLRAAGNLVGLAGSNMYLFLDDFNLGLTSGYASYSQDVEFTVRATPYSNIGALAYRLDIRARKTSGDTETTDIQVWNGSSWTTRYSVTAAHTAFTIFNSYYLTSAEYNNGNVRVRYVDTVPNGDTNLGGIDVEYQRLTVDQGVCVDQVQDIEADCGKCHNYNGDTTKPWPALGMHNKHAQTESISDCLWCHPNNGTDSAHRNNAVTIAGTKVFRAADGNLNGAPATATYDGITKQCSNVDCHKGLTTPAWTAAYVPSGFDGVNNIARNCSRCHNSGVAGADNASDLNISVAWPSTGDGGGHNSHNAVVAFNEYSCQGAAASCHPDNRGQHSPVGDGVVVVKMAPIYGSPNQVIKYLKDATNGTGRCANVSCHGGQVTDRFNLASTNPINLTAINGTACVKCHTPEMATGWGTALGNASQYNAPISGLHRGAPAVSGQDHSTTITNGCQGCHTLASLTRHFQFGGVTNLDTPGMDSMQGAAFVASVGYLTGTGTAPNYTTPPTCGTTGTTTCHAENRTANRNPATQWRRKWSWDSYDTVDPVKPCNNCHGHWGTFVSGVVEPHVLSNSDGTLRTTLINNHSDQGANCATMCHGQGGSNYVHGVVVGGTTKDMSLNTNAGVVKTAGPPARVGCNVCHSATDGTTPDGGNGTNHVFAESNWVTDTLVTGSTTVSCYNPGGSVNCHGNRNGTSKQSWPDGVTPNVYPNRAGRHDVHIAQLAAKLNYTAPYTDTQQKAMCDYCHNDAAGSGGSGHGAFASPSNVGTFNHIGNALADANGTYTSTAPGTCTTVDCHNNKLTTSGTFGWYNSGTSTCLMCHTLGGATNDPNSGLHSVTPTISGATGTHDDSFGTGGTCTTCHATLPAQAVGSTHINGSFTADAMQAQHKINMGLFASYSAVDITNNGTGTCASTGVQGTGCHGSVAYGAGDNGTWARKWNSAWATATGATNECKQCHGGMAGNADWNFGSTTVNTGDTTVDHQGNYDAVGGSQMFGNHGGLTPATACNLCHVYADAPYTAGAFATYHRNGSITLNDRLGMTAGSNSCTTTCHTNGGSHTVDASGWGKQMVVGPALTCVTCHATVTTHIDADGPGATYVSGTCTDCHTDHNIDTRDTAGVNNVLISTIYGRVVNPGTGDDTGTLVPTMNKQYASHDSWIQLGGAATNAYAKSTEAEMCWACHDGLGSAVLQAKTITFTANTIVDSGAGFVTAGFVANKPVKISGSSVAANNKWATPTTVIAGTMTFPAATFTADASAGEVVTLQNNVSEWRTNTSTATGSSPYDYGQLFTDGTAEPGTKTSNWVAGGTGSKPAVWRSGKGLNSTLTTNPYWYKRGAIRSTHSANYDGTTAANDTGKPWKGTLTTGEVGYDTANYNKNENLDSVANIRCTYCHDVHGTHDNINGDTNPAGATPSGQPYLRGTWLGNPYQEDGAPRFGMASWTPQGDAVTPTLPNTYNNLPRVNASSTNNGSATAGLNVGGWWIDQNSNNPVAGHATTSFRTATGNAGLCAQCHGTDQNGTWTAAEIGAIDQITGEALWVSGGNGHANAVISATGVTTTAANIFSRTKRGTGGTRVNGSTNKTQVDMGLATETTSGYSYRNNTGYGWTPSAGQNTQTTKASEQPEAYFYFAWNTTMQNAAQSSSFAAGTVELTMNTGLTTDSGDLSQSKYHTFSCSKCHNPHASRLPKLMITNCLDTNHNTWEDNSTFTQTTAIPAGNYAGLRHSQWASAQNCHRLDSRMTATTPPATPVGSGWNKVTPWIEDTAPNPASGAGGKTAELSTLPTY